MANDDNAVYVMMEKMTKAVQTIIAIVVVFAAFILFYALLFKDINGVAKDIILFVLGIQLIQAPSVRFQKSPAMEIPMTVPYAAIPVGCVLMMVNVLRATWRTWKGVQKPATHVEAA